MRRKTGGGFLANLFDCFYCLSLWVSVPFALLVGQTVRERVCLWLAFSAGAILLDRATSKEAVPHVYLDNGEKDDGMLRTGEKSAEDDNTRA